MHPDDNFRKQLDMSWKIVELKASHFKKISFYRFERGAIFLLLHNENCFRRVPPCPPKITA